MSTKPDSEDAAIEQPTIALFAELGWETLNCYQEVFAPYGGPPSTLGRETMAEAVLNHRLRAAIETLNPGITPNTLEIALQEVTKDRSAMSPARANQAVYKLLKDGVTVSCKRGGDENEEEIVETIRLVDWTDPANNDFLLASQFWISGDYGKKRADLIGFVNGIPLVFLELKASHRKLELAYEKNLSDYKDTIPQVFWYNAFVILSNGSQARIGSITAGFEHFAEWKKIDGEREAGLISLETIVRGTCEKRKLLDLVENFILYNEARGDLTKLVAKNHQFLGVNNAIAAVEHIQENRGKLGVFWHTQGSGKSYSMVFFSQKVLRKIPGNWTFVVVTDREDLDGQIYRNFANTGALLEDEKRVRADSGESLKRMLNQEDHRYVFTLIQKFRTEHGERYPVLSERSDIIVITDEAHRSQYDLFAANMRSALPNAAFIGFTGTPLMAGEERTREVFGEYVSVYNFKESVDDENTVPLYYENRIPEVQLVNDDLNEQMAEIIEDAGLDDDQQAKLEREFKREYQLITREDRLERIGEDIVAHYMGRGVLAKAMVISIDKATAVRTFDKVRKHWKIALSRLRGELDRADPMDKPELEKRLQFFEESDMAVVVSPSQNEIEEFRKKGLDIATHRKRMVKEDLETKFKKDDDTLRIVFVCAMWITGFDVPSCSTIYLDKPMKNHTLMQTIARANRVFRDKRNGLIVDYAGVFRNLQKALAIYGAAREGNGDTPIHDKSELARQLREAIATTTAFCRNRKADPAKIRDARGFEREKLKEDAVAALVVNDETRRQYLNLASGVDSLFKSLLPDASAFEFSPICNVFKVVAEKIRLELPVVDISAVMADVEALLNRSIAAGGYVMPPVSNDPSRYIDLSQIDFESLREQFEKGRKAVEVQKLRAKITVKLAQMVKLNRTRMDFLEEFQRMIDAYNAGSSNVEAFFAKLMAFAKKLNSEEKRGIAENLTEEELVIFDLLTKPDMALTKQEAGEVKKVAKSLLGKLKREKLVLDWRKQQTTRAMVFTTIQDALDQLPRAYTKELYEAKCDVVYQHFYEAYMGQGKSVYAAN
ncbi:MAG: type I restriction endonuclease subunit R [Bryobacterales bacterium]|nr:type I restriction endonuclease subunit R [Bryobacterales bacterium]